MLSLGWQEMAAIFVVALVLFGPRKLPELGRTIGRAIAEFRRATSELKATFDREMQQIERENESLKQTASTYLDDTTSYGSHDSTYYDPDGYRYGSYDSTTASNPEQVSDPAISGAESTSTAGHSTVTTEPAEGIVARSSVMTAEPSHTESSETAEAHSPESAAAPTPVEHKA